MSVSTSNVISLFCLHTNAEWTEYSTHTVSSCKAAQPHSSHVSAVARKYHEISGTRAHGHGYRRESVSLRSPLSALRSALALTPYSISHIVTYGHTTYEPTDHVKPRNQPTPPICLHALQSHCRIGEHWCSSGSPPRSAIPPKSYAARVKVRTWRDAPRLRLVGPLPSALMCAPCAGAMALQNLRATERAGSAGQGSAGPCTTNVSVGAPCVCSPQIRVLPGSSAPRGAAANES